MRCKRISEMNGQRDWGLGSQKKQNRPNTSWAVSILAVFAGKYPDGILNLNERSSGKLLNTGQNPSTRAGNGFRHIPYLRERLGRGAGRGPDHAMKFHAGQVVVADRFNTHQ